jgi:hypothetical protein
VDLAAIVAGVGWGISVAGWLVSPMTSELLDKCFSYIGFPSPEKVEEMQRKILQLMLLLEATTEDCPQRARLEQWMKELKTAFHEAEVILDAIDYDRLKSHVIPFQAVSRTKQVRCLIFTLWK